MQAAASLTACAIAIVLGDWLGRLGDVFRTTQAANLHRRARRVRAAQRLVATLGGLKGIFAKAGQFGSLRHDLLAPEVSEALAQLRDRVPPLHFDRIRETVELELGAPLDEWFSEFDPVPLGSASIAQVHRATLVDGTPVAVKVQYPWIAASQPRDVALARLLLSAWVFWTGRRDLDAVRLFSEFTEGLEEELDFRAEARAARAIARAYAKQVFADGQFHADPHPGNLFVIDEPEAATKPRVLFVDFGLCKRLDAALRADLRKGIFAILQRDRDALLEAIKSMGMVAPGAEAGVATAIETMFERIAEAAGEGSRRSDSSGGGVLGIGNSGVILSLKDEAKRLLQETPGLQLPNDLVLYAKTLSYLFALGEELDPEVDLMKISFPHLMKFLASND